MKVGTGAAAGISYIPDYFALFNIFARVDRRPEHMGIACRNTVFMVQDHVIAHIRPVYTFGDNPVGGRHDWFPRLGGNIYPLVEL